MKLLGFRSVESEVLYIGSPGTLHSKSTSALITRQDQNTESTSPVVQAIIAINRKLRPQASKSLSL